MYIATDGWLDFPANYFDFQELLLAIILTFFSTAYFATEYFRKNSIYTMHTMCKCSRVQWVIIMLCYFFTDWYTCVLTTTHLLCVCLSMYRFTNSKSVLTIFIINIMSIKTLQYKKFIVILVTRSLHSHLAYLKVVWIKSVLLFDDK